MNDVLENLGREELIDELIRRDGEIASLQTELEHLERRIEECEASNNEREGQLADLRDELLNSVPIEQA